MPDFPDYSHRALNTEQLPWSELPYRSVYAGGSVSASSWAYGRFSPPDWGYVYEIVFIYVTCNQPQRIPHYVQLNGDTIYYGNVMNRIAVTFPHNNPLRVSHGNTIDVFIYNYSASPQVFRWIWNTYRQRV